MDCMISHKNPILFRDINLMDEDQHFGEMVDVCLKANAAVVKTGTPAMIAMMRALLWQLGQEAAQREARAEKEDRHDAKGGFANINRVISKIGDSQ